MRRLALLVLMSLVLSPLAALELRVSTSVHQGVGQAFHFIEGGGCDVRTSFSTTAGLSVLLGDDDTVLIGPGISAIFNSRTPALERMFYSGYIQAAGGIEARIALPGPFALGLEAALAIGRYEDVDVTISSILALIAFRYEPVEYFSLSPAISIAFNGSDVTARFLIGLSFTSGDLL